MADFSKDVSFQFKIARVIKGTPSDGIVRGEKGLSTERVNCGHTGLVLKLDSLTAKDEKHASMFLKWWMYNNGVARGNAAHVISRFQRWLRDGAELPFVHRTYDNSSHEVEIQIVKEKNKSLIRPN